MSCAAAMERLRRRPSARHAPKSLSIGDTSFPRTLPPPPPAAAAAGGCRAWARRRCSVGCVREFATDPAAAPGATSVFSAWSEK